MDDIIIKCNNCGE